MAIAIVGLGLMGSRMASRLLSDGFELRGFDPDPLAMRQFIDAGGQPAESPAGAADGCWGVLLSLPDSEVSRQVCLGLNGISAAQSPPGFIFDTSTGRPSDAESLHRDLKAIGISYLDSTVSGSGDIASRGELVVMVGGTESGYAAGIPLFESIGRAHYHLGAPGAGARAKLLVNQLLIENGFALAEGLVLAERSGLDPTRTLALLRETLAYSRAVDLWGEKMISADFNRPVARLRQAYKDVSLILENALAIGAPSGLIEVVETVLSRAWEAGLEDADTSAMIELIRETGRDARDVTRP